MPGFRRDRSRSPQRGGPPAKRSFGGGPRFGGGGGGKMGSIDFDKTVFISNIPFEVRWMELKDIIREKAGEVSFVEMLETPDGKSKGCAVAEMKDKEGRERALNDLHRTSMKDRELVVKEIRDPTRFFRRIFEETGVDFLGSGDRRDAGRGRDAGMDRGGGRDGPASYNFETYGLSPSFLKQLGIEGPLTNRVFVANLPYTTTPSRVKDIFSLCGRVTDVDLYLDKDGRSKGISVVEFTHPIEAVQAVSMLNTQKYHDRGIVVKMDRHDKVPEFRPGELPPGLSAMGMGLGANGAPLTNIDQVLAAQNPSLGPSASDLSRFAAPAQQTSFDMPSTNFERSSLFSTGSGAGFGGGGGGSGAFNNGNGATFRRRSPEPQRLSEAFGRGAASTIRAGSPARQSPTAGSNSRWGPPAARGGGGAAGRTVLIRNLPPNMAWQALKDLAREAGEVDYVEMLGVDIGRVTYKNAESTERAIRGFGGFKYEGRTLSAEPGS